MSLTRLLHLFLCTALVGQSWQYEIIIPVVGASGQPISYFQWDSQHGGLRESIESFVKNSIGSGEGFVDSLIALANQEMRKLNPLEQLDLSDTLSLSVSYIFDNEDEMRSMSFAFTVGELMHHKVDVYRSIDYEITRRSLHDMEQMHVPSIFDELCIRSMADLLTTAELATLQAEASKSFHDNYAFTWQDFAKFDGSVSFISTDADDASHASAIHYLDYVSEYYSTMSQEMKLMESRHIEFELYDERAVNATTVKALVDMLHSEGSAEDEYAGVRGHLLSAGNYSISKAYIDLDACFHILKNVVINTDKNIEKIGYIPESNFGMPSRSEAFDFVCRSSLHDRFVQRAVGKQFQFYHHPAYEAYDASLDDTSTQSTAQTSTQIMTDSIVTLQLRDWMREVSKSLNTDRNEYVYTHPVDPPQSLDDDSVCLRDGTCNQTASSGGVAAASGLRPIRIAGKNVFYVSSYELFSDKNIAHMQKAGDLFWAFAAARRTDSDVRKHFAGAVLMPPPFGVSSMKDVVMPFYKLFHRTLLRYALENQIILYMEFPEQMIAYVDDHKGSLRTLYDYADNRQLIRSLLKGDPPSSPSADFVKTSGNVMFPMLLEHPVLDAITPPGAALMKARMLHECDLLGESDRQIPLSYFVNVTSEVTSPQTSHARDDGNVKGEESFVVLVSVRKTNRHIRNIEEVIEALAKRLRESPALSHYKHVTIEAAYFGALSPCEQIRLADRANMFLFVHSAEGSLSVYMRPGAMAVDIHPGGCCLSDFFANISYYRDYAYAVRAHYHFFTGTISSSPVCTTFQGGLKQAPNCGTIVLINLFEEAVDYWLKQLFRDKPLR